MSPDLWQTSYEHAHRQTTTLAVKARSQATPAVANQYLLLGGDRSGGSCDVCGGHSDTRSGRPAAACDLLDVARQHRVSVGDGGGRGAGRAADRPSAGGRGGFPATSAAEMPGLGTHVVQAQGGGAHHGGVHGVDKLVKGQASKESVFVRFARKHLLNACRGAGAPEHYRLRSWQLYISLSLYVPYVGSEVSLPISTAQPAAAEDVAAVQARLLAQAEAAYAEAQREEAEVAAQLERCKLGTFAAEAVLRGFEALSENAPPHAADGARADQGRTAEAGARGTAAEEARAAGRTQGRGGPPGALPALA